jgi:hypothetical protein
MYVPHPHLVEPPDNAKLWRYMDFTKFLALLETQTLHMASLTSFDDPFDGHPPKSVMDAFTTLPTGLSEEELKQQKQVVIKNLEVFQNTRKLVFASCWHISPHESAAMWSQYLRTGEGIAIQTSTHSLKAAIADEPQDLMGAVVQYVDFESFDPRDVNILIWATLKRKSFEHEREFRLLAMGEPNPQGFPIKINPQILIENIYVAPTTPDWVLNLVISILNRYQLEITPARSELADEPKYFTPPRWVRDD